MLGIFYKVWCSTLRFAEYGREQIEVYNQANHPLVITLWHDELFALPYKKGTLRLVTVVSQSRDGEFLSAALEHIGIQTARGSSSRGGVRALLHAAKLMRDEGLSACVTIDGPRGPRHKVKDGAIFLAYKAKALLVPVRLKLHSPKIFEQAWDKFQVPLPFSKVSIYYETPYYVESDTLDEETLDKERKKLQVKLDTLIPCKN